MIALNIAAIAREILRKPRILRPIAVMVGVSAIYRSDSVLIGASSFVRSNGINSVSYPTSLVDRVHVRAP